MLRISRSETRIALSQSRDRLGRGNDWLIWMREISCSDKVVSAKQTEHDEATDDLWLSHAVIYEGTGLFVQFESQNGTNRR
jgi:hypothetical protein